LKKLIYTTISWSNNTVQNGEQNKIKATKRPKKASILRGPFLK
jgi:hypothetical protein